MLALRRHSGYLLMLTGALHTTLGVILFWQPLRDILQSGLINSVTPHYDRGMVVWFLLFGILLVLVGHSVQWTLARYRTLPSSLGWGLLGIAVIGCVIIPLSGFWLVIPQAYLLIMHAGQHEASRSV